LEENLTIQWDPIKAEFEVKKNNDPPTEMTKFKAINQQSDNLIINEV
jgi:hypothetical protein